MNARPEVVEAVEKARAGTCVAVIESLVAVVEREAHLEAGAFDVAAAYADEPTELLQRRRDRLRSFRPEALTRADRRELEDLEAVLRLRLGGPG